MAAAWHRAIARRRETKCVAKGLAVVQGDADTDLENYPDDAFDFVILSQTLQATRASRARRARTYAADRAARDRVVSQFRPLAHPPADCSRRPHAAHRKSAIRVVRNAEHPLLQHQGLSPALSGLGRQDRRGSRAQCLGPAHAAENALVVLEPVRRAGGVSAEQRSLTRIVDYPVPRRLKSRHKDAAIIAVRKPPARAPARARSSMVRASGS